MAAKDLLTDAVGESVPGTLMDDEDAQPKGTESPPRVSLTLDWRDENAIQQFQEKIEDETSAKLSRPQAALAIFRAGAKAKGY